MDGIDVALLDGDGERIARRRPRRDLPLSRRRAGAPARRRRRPAGGGGAADDLERDVTDAHVAAVERFLAEHAIARASVALVGLHGQTVLHRPRSRYTRQLCDGARAAARLGLDVVCDFRSADVAAGGEGAPLVPLYHAAIAAGLERPLMLLNWGGVGNVTYLGPNDEIVAFDTGPANAPLDDFVRRRLGLSHDENGALAATGPSRSRPARALDARPLFPPPRAEIARPQPFPRACRRRRGAVGRRRRGDARRLHASRRPRRRSRRFQRPRAAGWSAAAGEEPRP